MKKINRWSVSILLLALTGCAGISQDKVDPVTKRDNLINTKTQLAIEFLANKDYRLAVNTIDEVIALNKSNAISWMTKGIIYQTIKDDVQAKLAYDKSLSLAPRSAEVNNNYGWFVCDSLHDPERSLSYFDTALKDLTYPSTHLAYMNKGICLGRLERYSEAEAVFKNAIIANPNFPYTFLELARLAYLQGDYQKAKEHLEHYESFNPPLRPADLSFGAQLAMRLGDKELYRHYIESLKKNFPYTREVLELRH